MGIFNMFKGYKYSSKKGFSYNCDKDCLSCRHLDVDCEGDEMEDEELFHELYDDEDDW